MSEATFADPIQPTKAYSVEKVTWIRHWTDDLFSLRTTRDPRFEFVSGQFVMVGLMTDEGAVLRAYSVASGVAEDELEFYSIKVPDGPLTSRLRHVAPGDAVLVGRKPTGTLVLGGLKPGRRLYLVGTGTGLAPWLSLVRDPATYERFGDVVVIHSVRQVQDLNYRELFEGDHATLCADAPGKLRYYPTVTREAFRNTGRVTDLIASGKLFADLDVAHLDPAVDRLMICGSPSVNADLKALLLDRGYVEGSVSAPGDFVLEKAFVDG
jgi:ferredoxin--NADP+ reductase